MSISLKSLYDQVQSIKNTTVISEYSNANPGFIKFNNGLQICYGKFGQTSRQNFAKAFSNTCVSVVAHCIYGRVVADGDINITSIDNNGFNCAVRLNTNHTYIAIGYLISNSIRSLLGGGLEWL